MGGLTFGIARLGAALAALVLLAQAALGQSSGALAMGVLAFRGEAEARLRWQPTADFLGRALYGLPVIVVPLTLEGARAALETGEIDLLLTNPGHYRSLADDYRLSPLATLRSDRAGRPETGNRYGAVIFTRAGRGDINHLSDLRGHSFAAVSAEAFGGYLIAAQTLRDHGIDPPRDLGKLAFMGFPQTAIVEAVVGGRVDAGTVRTGVLEQMIAEGRIAPGAVEVLNATRVPGFDLMLSTRLVPEWTLAATPDLPEPLRRQIAVALLNMPSQTRAAQAGGYGGWTTPMNDAAVSEILSAAAPPASTGTRGILAALALALAALIVAALALRRRLAAATPSGAAPEGPDVALTRREGEVLDLIEQGQTTKEIARSLGISPKTVEFHRGHLIRKFGVRNMAELVHRARGRPAP